jgi:hypothetical protein
MAAGAFTEEESGRHFQIHAVTVFVRQRMALPGRVSAAVKRPLA